MKTFNRSKIALLAAMIFFSACEHSPLLQELDSIANPKGPSGNNGGEQGNPCDPDTVYFVNDIQPILRSNCAFSGCHGDGSAQDDVDLTTYGSVMNTARVRAFDTGGSKLYKVITERDPEDIMPPAPANALSADQIAKIAKWINQGALNNSCDGCDTTTVSFSLNISPIIQNNCQGCHSGGNPSAGIMLTNYDQIQAQALTGRLYGVVSHGAGYVAMPYNQGKLSQCKIDQIRIWVENGALND